MADREADDDAQRQRQLTQAQLDAIDSEIKSSQPLASTLLPISALVRQYDAASGADDGGGGQRDGFARSAEILSDKYASMRRIRGDGNCYYRAFLYSLCEQLLRRRAEDEGDAEFKRLGALVSKLLEWVCGYGYEEFTVEMFHEELVELFDFIGEVAGETSDDGDGDGADPLEEALARLHSRLNEENACSDYCTWFLRVVAAAEMKSDPGRYLPFVMAEGDFHDVPAFCAREVEPMGRECGMVQVSALAERMGVRVVIEYVDGRIGEGETVACHVFGEGGNGGNKGDGGERITVTLLYRPGHYDVLY